MLVSHQKKFIYTKTIKTASTSVESYYEPFCMPEGKWEESHGRKEYVSETGIIGYRGKDPSGFAYFNHMSAARIKDLIGEETWNSYFKFTVIRNPFSKLVSGWYYFHRPNVRLISTLKLSVKNPSFFSQLASGKRDIIEFRSWIQSGGEIIDRDIFMIDDEVAVDYFIKHESLLEGIEHVNSVLGISNVNRKVPNFKSGIRSNKFKIREFFDDETEKIVRKKYAWEIKYFGYDMPTD